MLLDPIVLNVFINRPIDVVWGNWTDPDVVRIWNVPDENWYCPEAKINLEANGSFYFRRERIDGTEGIEYSGTYHDVIPGQLVTYTLSDGRKAIVEFQHIDENTILRESIEPARGLDWDMQRACNQSILNRFKSFVEGL